MVTLLEDEEVAISTRVVAEVFVAAGVAAAVVEGGDCFLDTFVDRERPLAKY
jgi:hypothetical protein